MAFADDVAKFTAKTKATHDMVFKKIVFEVYSRVAQRTPVDTGRARAGWQVGSSITASSPLGPISKAGGPEVGRGGAVSLGKLPGMHFASALKGLSTVGSGAGAVAFIFNNVVYIVPLEYGHSKQAPAGMVRVTVAEFQQIVNMSVSGLK
jgi:hypothetical protein